MTDDAIITPAMLKGFNDGVKAGNKVLEDVRARMKEDFSRSGASARLRISAQKDFQHILKQDVKIDVEPYATIPAGTPIFGEDQNGFVVFKFGEKNVQIAKEYFV